MQRPVPLHSGSAEFGIGSRCQIAEAAVRPDRVVILHPNRQRFARMGERGEQCFVQQLVTQTTVEAFDESVCCGLPGAM